MNEKMETILKDMENSGTSEGRGVAEILRDIWEAGHGQDSEEFMIVCAGEIRDWAQGFIDRMSK